MKKVEIVINDVPKLSQALQGNLLYIVGLVDPNDRPDQAHAKAEAFYKKAWEVFKKATNNFTENLEALAHIESLTRTVLSTDLFTAEEKYFFCCLGSEKFRNITLFAYARLSEENAAEVSEITEKVDQFSEVNDELTINAIREILSKFEEDYGIPTTAATIYGKSSACKFDLSTLAAFIGHESTTPEEKQELKTEILDFCSKEHPDMNPLEAMVLRALQSQLLPGGHEITEPLESPTSGSTTEE